MSGEAAQAALVAAVAGERARCLAWAEEVLAHYGTGPLRRLREMIVGGVAAPPRSSAGGAGSAVAGG